MIKCSLHLNLRMPTAVKAPIFIIKLDIGQRWHAYAIGDIYI